jgi:UDP-glucose 4-epimerase
VSVVRYGNVMVSRGSVIPLFAQQAKAGQPLTVTDPHMTRFLMSLAESVALVEYALAEAQPGDLLVRKSPACTVGDLATAVAMVLEATPKLEIIGSRHGEKVYETLLSREEMSRAEDLEDFYRVPLDVRSLDYSRYFDEGDARTSEGVDYTSHNAPQLDVAAICDLLRSLPEFSV